MVDSFEFSLLSRPTFVKRHISRVARIEIGAEGGRSMRLVPYDRAAAVRYAHEWAYGRNPRYYDYELLGGDCTKSPSVPEVKGHFIIIQQ